MGIYEVMFIVRPDLETVEQEEAISGLQDAITKNHGTVGTVVDWRKRRLSYEIDKHIEGHYYIIYFSGEGTIIPEIEHYFRVTDAVIRYMVVRADEQEFEKAAEKAAAEAARAEEAAKEETVTVSEAEEPAAVETATEVVEAAPEAEETPEAEEAAPEAEETPEAEEAAPEVEEAAPEAEEEPADKVETEQ
jgi:small subunit ribosomal protein S6